MQVALDEQIFLLQTQGGISRYFVELIRNLPLLSPPVHVSTPFRSIVNRHALESLSDDRFRSARGPLQPYTGLFAAATRPRRREAVDLVHHTFYHPRFLRDHPRVPKVVTIYDMIPEMVGAHGRFGGPHMAKREYVSRADLLLFISASARDDLMEIFGVPSSPCVVTHLGVDERFRRGGTLPSGFPPEYVFFVGEAGRLQGLLDRDLRFRRSPPRAARHAPRLRRRRSALWRGDRPGGGWRAAGPPPSALTQRRRDAGGLRERRRLRVPVALRGIRAPCT